MKTIIEPSKNSSQTIFWGLATYQAIGMIAKGTFNTFIAIYLKNYLGLPVSMSILYSTLPLIVNAIFQPMLWGKVSDYFHIRKSLIIGGELCASVIMLVFYFLHANILDLNLAGYIIVAGLSIAEIFWSMSGIGWTSLISDLYPPKLRGQILRKVTGIGGIGRTIGIYLAGYLYNGFGQHYDGWGFHEGAIFYVFICGLTLSIIPIHFLIPKDSQIFQKKKIMEKEEIMEKGEITEKKDNADKKEILLKQGYRSESDNSRLFSIFLLGLALINFGRGAFYVIFSQYLELTNGLNCPNTLISQILSLHSVVIIITGFTSGRVLKIMKPGNLFILNSILLMIYIWLAVFTSTLLVIYIVVILWGITSVLLSITSYIYVSVLIPTKTRGKMFAWYNFSISVASGIFGPFFAGFLVDLLLSEGYIDVQAYKITFFLSSLVSLLGLTLIVILESKRRYISFQENIDLS